MWNEKRSSPSAATGETTATSRSSSPEREERDPPPRHGRSAPRERPRRTPYATPTITSGASWSGSSVQSPIEL